ncbi:MAG: hypothetical protein H0W61_17715, partial [Bacteroidetes bacterium]|nr:hypothetical protein [Bacteroidota bacterium]
MSVTSVSRALTIPADSGKKNYSISGFPIVFYTPETRFGFGAVSILAFRFKGDSLKSKPSQVQFGFAYTQNKQVLFYLPFRLYHDRENYICYGELGYYRYFYNFYGIGNQQQSDFKETYGVNFPRLRLNLLKKLKRNFYTGLKYWFENFKITSLDSVGQLSKSEITGSKGGTTS